MLTEQKRIQDHYNNKADWLKWGPYISDRQWGVVREDYSANGDAWNYITHDMARSKAYRWGEDGIGGLSDDKQLLCISLALWNGKDPILKERLFGLTNSEGNHGEDVKELYYYLVNTPSHSYQKMLYKYPQGEYPYGLLVHENKQRGKLDPEFELLDTGLFDHDKYFDVFIEYAKEGTDDILIRYTIHNRGESEAQLHVLPQLWFRNTWNVEPVNHKPYITLKGDNALLIHADQLGDYYCYTEGSPRFLCTENETNSQRLYNSPNTVAHTKDGINNRVVNGAVDAVNDNEEGTKVAAWYTHSIAAHESVEIKLRFTNKQTETPFANFDEVFAQRIKEAAEFYAALQTNIKDEDERNVQQQAWAGMLWSKQFYNYNVNRWLYGDEGQVPPPAERKSSRNSKWGHFVASSILSMPDKWEYPWFAAWDLAFHCIAFAPIDAEFAKNQLRLLVKVNYMHPSGQLPAYEWDFSDVNPPVHALAAWQVYKIDKDLKGVPDNFFLEEIFQKLLLNFTWWVNRKDSEGNNIFEGGFLGLDNIGVFNRSAPVPGGGHLEQADGTSWMAMYALNMAQIAIELASHNPVYESMAIKFFEHFLFIAGSMTEMGQDSVGLWDDDDGFFYDLLRKPDGSWDRLRLRTLVGLIPMFATIVFDESKWSNLPMLKERMDHLKDLRPDLAALVSNWTDTKGNEQHLLSLLRGHRMKLLLRRMLDTKEFLSEFGIRSISKAYDEKPYEYWLNGADFSVKYVPGESDTSMFGGNSNWRGPIWMPINFLIIQSLYIFQEYYTDDFKVEYPSDSGNFSSLAEVATGLSKRLKNIFLRNEKGERPVFGGHPKLNNDPHFKDYILFHEYFHGETGKGLGASHQTGWTGLIAVLK